MEGLIIDCFAGGGGASVGIEMALGRQVDIAINHDPEAIRMHKVNHPKTLHLTEDIFRVDLQRYVGGRPAALMWASPDCTSHSKAKGGKPREKGLRILPWAVYKHAKQILPEVILMENVEEIRKWGPLDEKGYPIKEKAGEDYRKFIGAMKYLGYAFESRELVAADYGAPTTRKRWYAVFRRDGRPIQWPEPTHSKGGAGGLKPWVPVTEVLDLKDLGKSIFGRKKPLAENTMRRIYRGLEKFVFRNPEPFIMKCYGGNYRGAGTDIHSSLHTITATDHNALVSPVLSPYMLRNNAGKPGSRVEEPLLTITPGGHHGLIAPLLIQYHSETGKKEVRGQAVKDPIMTLDTSNRYGIVTGFLTKFYKSGTGQRMDEPLHTITTSPGHFGAVTVRMVEKEALAGVGEEAAEKCTWVSRFIMEYYGQGTGQKLTDPLHTIVSKDRFALITVLGAEYVILDIFLRMLKPEELKLAQGFPKDYIIDRDADWRPYPIKKQVARIGNSVVPLVAKALVEVNCGYLKVGERAPSLGIWEEQEGQMQFFEKELS